MGHSCSPDRTHACEGKKLNKSQHAPFSTPSVLHKTPNAHVHNLARKHHPGDSHVPPCSIGWLQHCSACEIDRRQINLPSITASTHHHDGAPGQGMVYLTEPNQRHQSSARSASTLAASRLHQAAVNF